MNVMEIINTIRDQSSAMYVERVPELTRNNLDAVGNAILSYEVLTNEFLSALVGRIGFTEVSNRRFKNPLAILKKSGRPFGTDIQEIYVNPTKGKTFDGSNTSDMLEINAPDVKTIYHRVNRKDKYSVSVSVPQLRQAFTSFSEMEYFITNSILIPMYSGDEMDEYLLMRRLISEAVANNKLVNYEVDYDGGEESCKGLIKVIKTLSSDFCFPRKDFNGYNLLNKSDIDAGTVTACTTWTPKENQIFLIRSDVDASTDVEVLAKAFNMEKTDFLKRKIVVDSFGDADTLCVITDENNFKVSDTEYCVRSFDNGSNLTTNYWLHHWQILSFSLFGNGVALKKKSA